MKLLKILALFIFTAALILLAKQSAEAALGDPFRPRCVGIYGKFFSKKWKGGSIEVGCSGTAGTACNGEIQKVASPGKFKLVRCSCFGTDKGCLKVGNDLKIERIGSKRKVVVVQRVQSTTPFTQNNCSITFTKRTGQTKLRNICGGNSKRVKANIKIRCEVPPVTVTACPGPNAVTNVVVTCPDCIRQEPEPEPTQGPEPSPTPTPTGVPTIQAFEESGGSVIMEAENNDGKFSRDGYRWDGAAPGTPNTATTGFSERGYIAARPNNDEKVFIKNIFSQGPEVVYNINFTNPGTYYVYVRSSGPDNKSDSAHFGLSVGLGEATWAGIISLHYIGDGSGNSNWRWEKWTNENERAKIEVPTAGIYKFHIYMREDGAKIDKIRLFKDQSWVADPNPTAKGPNESQRRTVIVGN